MKGRLLLKRARAACILCPLDANRSTAGVERAQASRSAWPVEAWSYGKDAYLTLLSLWTANPNLQLMPRHTFIFWVDLLLIIPA